MDLEYVFVDFADGYWRGASKEKRRLKKRKKKKLLVKPKYFTKGFWWFLLRILSWDKKDDEMIFKFYFINVH